MDKIKNRSFQDQRISESKQAWLKDKNRGVDPQDKVKM